MTVEPPPEDASPEDRPPGHGSRDARFLALAELNPVATFVLTGEHVAYANPAALALLGAKDFEEMRGRSVFDFVEQSHHDLLRARLDEASTGRGQGTASRCRWRPLPGGSVDVEIRAGATTWGEEAAVQVLARDLAEEKVAGDALDHSETRYRALFDAIDEGFCIVEVLFDDEGRARDYVFREVNRSFEKQTGIQDAVGRRMRDINADHEAHWFEIYGRVAATRVPARFENAAEALGHYYDVYAFPVGDPQEHLVAVLFRDIADKKQLEDALRRLARELTRANERKDEFLAMLGHELRNPLAAIRYATEVIKLASSGEPRLDRARSVVERQAAQMTRLVDGLLEVSRIARGKVEVQRAPLDLGGLVASAVADRKTEATERGLDLVFIGPATPLWVSGDAGRLSQVLDNLLGNAIKFTEAGGRVTVSVNGEGEEAVIRVRDTGAGIDPGFLEVVFEAFRQGDPGSGPGGGLGLGLALAKGLVDLHDGTIEARSEGTGQGAEFEIRLPRIPSPEPSASERNPDATASQAILLVEDNPDAAAALQEMLELLGHRVTHVPTATEGLAHLREEAVDLVLCDIGLPGMDGLSFAREVRADPALRELPLAAVTGYGQPADRARSEEAGFDAHLTKPVAPAALEAWIRKVQGQAVRGSEGADGG